MDNNKQTYWVPDSVKVFIHSLFLSHFPDLIVSSLRIWNSILSDKPGSLRLPLFYQNGIMLFKYMKIQADMQRIPFLLNCRKKGFIIGLKMQGTGLSVGADFGAPLCQFG